jgi:hypothetical protein
MRTLMRTSARPGVSSPVQAPAHSLTSNRGSFAVVLLRSRRDGRGHLHLQAEGRSPARCLHEDDRPAARRRPTRLDPRWLLGADPARRARGLRGSAAAGAADDHGHAELRRSVPDPPARRRPREGRQTAEHGGRADHGRRGRGMSAPPSECTLLAAERELRRKPAGAQKAVSEGIYLRLDRVGHRRFLQSEVKYPRTVIRTTVGMRGNPAEGRATSSTSTPPSRMSPTTSRKANRKQARATPTCSRTRQAIWEFSRTATRQRCSSVISVGFPSSLRRSSVFPCRNQRRSRRGGGASPGESRGCASRSGSLNVRLGLFLPRHGAASCKGRSIPVATCTPRKTGRSRRSG